MTEFGPAGPRIDIEDPFDPRIQDYRDIRERDLVGRRNLFVAEGRVVLEKLVRSDRFGIRSLLVAQHRLDSLSDLLERIPASVPVYSAGQPVMDAIAGFPIHRGILAIGSCGDANSAYELLESLDERSTIMLLCGIANHDNMGGLFRNAAAFGVDAVLLDSDCCDPLYRKSIRVSVGAALLVPFARLSSGSEAIDLLEARGFQTLALSPGGAKELTKIRPQGRTAVLFGAEGPGLPDRLLERTATVRIQMSSGFDSLNVATTSGIVLHHLSRR